MNEATERVLLGATGLFLCLAASSCTTTGISGNAERLAGNAEPLAVLIDGLKSEDPVIRADAARLLGDLRAREAIDPLVKYVTTDRGHGKTAGLDALARIGDPAVCPRIRSLVNQPMVPEDAPWYGHSAVRLSAAIALLSRGDQSGLPFLREIVNRKDDDSDPDAGMWALYTWFAPTVLALPDTLPPAPELKRGITFDRLLPKEKRDPGQIVVIARALGMLGTEQAQAKLVELLSFPSRYVRASAAASLLKASPTREHLNAVAKLEANDPTEFVRIKASLALALAGEERYIPVIVKAARQSEDSFERSAAVESLGLLGRSEYMPLLLSQLRHEDAFVRLSAIEARVPGATTVYANCAAGDINLTQVLPVSLEDANSAEALQYVRDSLAILSKRFADAVVPSIPTDGYIRPTSFRQATEYGTGRGVQVSALLLDNIALGVVPGEMFSEFGDLMHESSPLGHLVLLGYGGGGGYVFPPVGYEQGGYELRNMPSPGTRGLDISNKLTEVLEQLVRSRVTQDERKPGLAAKRE